MKNNLQQIIALMVIESARIDAPAAKEALACVTSRVLTLGAVHQLLIAKPGPSQLRVSEFLKKLCGRVGSNLNSRNVKMRVHAPAELLSVDVAVPLGLLVHDLIANSLRHAFPDGGPGLIFLEYLRREDGRIELTVADDGRVSPDEVGATITDGAEARVIRSMVRQLRGTARSRSGNGTAVTITLPSDINERLRYA